MKRRPRNPSVTTKRGRRIEFYNPTDGELEALGRTREEHDEMFLRAIELAHGLDRERLN
jgi:hypothetical protein